MEEPAQRPAMDRSRGCGRRRRRGRVTMSKYEDACDGRTDDEQQERARRAASSRSHSRAILLAEPVVVDGVRPEVADRVDLAFPDGKHEVDLTIGAQIEVQREAATGMRRLSLEPRRAGGTHADDRAVLRLESGRRRPVVRQLPRLVVDRVRPLTLAAAAIDEGVAADARPHVRSILSGRPVALRTSASVETSMRSGPTRPSGWTVQAAGVDDPQPAARTASTTRALFTPPLSASRT